VRKLLFLAALTCAGCGSLSSLSSYPEASTTSASLEYPYYDSPSKLLYRISNTDEELHVRLRTAEKTTIMKMVRAGLTVYLDVNGKKGKQVSVRYPIKQNTQLTPGEMNPGMGGNAGVPQDLNSMLARVPSTALYQNGETTQRYDVLLANSPIKASMRVINEFDVEYHLTIPLKLISPDGMAALENLSIGIVSGSFDRPSPGSMGANSRSAGNMPSNGGGMPAGANMPGGGGMPGGGAMPGGMPNGGGRMPNGSLGAVGDKLMVPVDFWFQIALVPSP